MRGPEILARSLSVPAVRSKKDGSLWQYHNRSDRHSKIACWGIVFDLMENCPLLRKHVKEQKVFFGINHEMRDFQQNRKKDLDLVLCTPAASGSAPVESLQSKAVDYGIVLSKEERKKLDQLPELWRSSVGSVVIALEAKACMTEHQKARPRLYDELNSSHLTVHGATDEAIAAGFVMINGATSFISPTRGLPPNAHKQPSAIELVKVKVSELPRRSGSGRQGFDALSIVIIDCPNDGSRVTLVNNHTAPQPGDAFHYDGMVYRLANLYATRFSLL